MPYVGTGVNAIEKRQYPGPRLSPDEQRITLQTGGKDWAGWIYDFPKQQLSRLPFDGQVEWLLWTLDGRRVVFAGLTRYEEAFPTLSPDGKWLAYWMARISSTPGPNLARCGWAGRPTGACSWWRYTLRRMNDAENIRLISARRASRRERAAYQAPD